MIIVFPDGTDWSLNNFAFRRLVVRHEAWFPEDVEGREVLELVAASGGCRLRQGEPRTERLLEVLQKIGERTVSEIARGGEGLVVDGPRGMDETARVYKRLLEMIARGRAAG